MKTLSGFLIALAIGIVCRLAGLPLPAPPVLLGALLVLSMTLGYVAVDRWLASRPASQRARCGGPSGAPVDRGEG